MIAPLCSFSRKISSDLRGKALRINVNDLADGPRPASGVNEARPRGLRAWRVGVAPWTKKWRRRLGPATQKATLDAGTLIGWLHDSILRIYTKLIPTYCTFGFNSRHTYHTLFPKTGVQTKIKNKTTNQSKWRETTRFSNGSIKINLILVQFDPSSADRTKIIIWIWNSESARGSLHSSNLLEECRRFYAIFRSIVYVKIKRFS